ncbi:DUF998 domain-containing protein [Thalassorhabdomicrobium marinisediminis]|uniref:DUF998 domain-containing protein n=1 Tax=Thalassorhabdomicrobium marinisediminis TaxID=2170577 RepID=A0A2T7FZF6_9RHOB|nr:DUF998 domain-containing protein [Thalassorhabdomicrobium marinisediminis]PVA07554.1 DUF998 domain-containing protein [Thalassorhabdomicrobium marinisediminis]
MSRTSRSETVRVHVEEQDGLIRLLAWASILGCVIFAAAVILADILVPNNSMIADTISDLGAGKYEYIVDTGLYMFSAGLLSMAVLAAHVHLGDWKWSSAIVALIVFGLLVFLIGARNEYGDADSDGWVIHRYLVYGLGICMPVVCFGMAEGAGRAGAGYRLSLRITGTLWLLAAPIFFFLPTDVDGLYERGLGLLSFAMILTLARLFLKRVHHRRT